MAFGFVVSTSGADRIPKDHYACHSYLHMLLSLYWHQVVVLSLTIFAFQTKIDFTMCGGFLFVAVIVLMCFGFAMIFWRNSVRGRERQTVGSESGLIDCSGHFSGLGRADTAVFISILKFMMVSGVKHDCNFQ